ncbi:hypothetical protein WME94_01600 [Sorangium sp. So ce429]
MSERRAHLLAGSKRGRAAAVRRAPDDDLPFWATPACNERDRPPGPPLRPARVR